MSDRLIDPTCLIHGLKKSEHLCLYCCLCFKSLTPDECSRDDDGIAQDVCVPCWEEEKQAEREAGYRE